MDCTIDSMDCMTLCGNLQPMDCVGALCLNVKMGIEAGLHCNPWIAPSVDWHYTWINSPWIWWVLHPPVMPRPWACRQQQLIKWNHFFVQSQWGRKNCARKRTALSMLGCNQRMSCGRSRFCAWIHLTKVITIIVAVFTNKRLTAVFCLHWSFSKYSCTQNSSVASLGNIIVSGIMWKTPMWSGLYSLFKEYSSE